MKFRNDRRGERRASVEKTEEPSQSSAKRCLLYVTTRYKSLLRDELKNRLPRLKKKVRVFRTGLDTLEREWRLFRDTVYGDTYVYCYGIRDIA